MLTSSPDLVSVDTIVGSYLPPVCLTRLQCAERILNRCVLAALCMMITIVFSLAAGAVLISPTPHVQLRLSGGESFFEHTLTFFVLFSFCIPMSLCMRSQSTRG